MASTLESFVYQPAHQTSTEDRERGGDWNVKAYGKRKRANAQNLYRNHQEHTQQDQSPRELASQDAVDHRGHQSSLRSSGVATADAMHPLDLNLARLGIVEVAAVWD